LTDREGRYHLRVAGPVERQLARLPQAAATAIVEFLVGALLDNPRRVGRPLRNELAGLHAARRGAYRVVYEIDDGDDGDADREPTVVVVRIDHRATAYRRH
jgi:mRNA-degrading endonuclease RelE of RelBE toxin-antitoxin system